MLTHTAAMSAAQAAGKRTIAALTLGALIALAGMASARASITPGL
jgi:hypothetical protein